MFYSSLFFIRKLCPIHLGAWGKRLRLQFFQGDFFGGSPLNMFLQGGGKSSIAEAAAFFLRSQDTGKDRQAIVPEDSQAGWCFFFKK
jgi:hypothetical protein